MPHQTSFTHAEFAAKKKTTRREKFLSRMEAVARRHRTPLSQGRTRPSARRRSTTIKFPRRGSLVVARGVGLERMLRVYFLQQWYGLADEALEDARYDSQALQGFARLDLSAEGVAAGVR